MAGDREKLFYLREYDEAFRNAFSRVIRLRGESARGTDAEVRTAFEGYTSYFGTYTIDTKKQTVTHHVRGASYPNWVATDQLRQYKFDGMRVSRPRRSLWMDKTFEFALIWERIQ
jgi:hypothetical protein